MIDVLKGERIPNPLQGQDRAIGSLGTRELNELLLDSRDALECRNVDELRSKILSRLIDIFGSDKGNFFLTRSGGKRLNLDNVVKLGVEDKAIHHYREYYCLLDPFYEKLFYPYPILLTTEQIIPFNKLDLGEYYSDFLKPQSIHYQMTVSLRSVHQTLGLIALFRPRKDVPYSNQEKRKAILMAPYLAAALEKVIALDQINESRRILTAMSMELPYEGILILDETIEPIWMNENVLPILSSIHGKHQQEAKEGFFLPEKIHKCCREIQNLLLQKAPIEQYRLNFDLIAKNRDQHINVYVRPIKDQGRTLFFLICLQPARPILSTLPRSLSNFGISQREREVVHLISQGLKNIEIAERLFVSKNTVENHIKSIFEKMGVHNRTSLIYRLNQMTK